MATSRPLSLPSPLFEGQPCSLSTVVIRVQHHERCLPSRCAAWTRFFHSLGLRFLVFQRDVVILISPASGGDEPRRLEQRWNHCAVCAQSLQSSPTLCSPVHCSPPRSSVHGTLQARILEWVALPSCRGSSRPRDQTRVSHIADGFFTY